MTAEGLFEAEMNVAWNRVSIDFMTFIPSASTEHISGYSGD